MPDRRQHQLTVQVEPPDIDDLGHVNNIVYLAWCERVAREHSARLGLDTAALTALGTAAVVHKHAITYHRPAMLGDTLRVVTAIASAQGPRATRETTIWREQTKLAECRTDCVWVDPITGRPKRPAADILRAFGMAEP